MLPKGKKMEKRAWVCKAKRPEKKKKAKSVLPHNLSSLMLSIGHWVHFQSVF